METAKFEFLSVDVETTGLDPDKDMIIQLGAVAFNMDGTFEEFSNYVSWPRYGGDAFALQMNAAILKKLATEEHPPAQVVAEAFKLWVNAKCVPKVTPVGWNVGPFDCAFLKKWGITFGHRCVELGTLFMNTTTGKPATSAAITREWLGREVTHDALQDARDARELMMRRLRG